MTEDKKDKIKVIDINGDNFFDDEDTYFENNAKSTSNDGFLTKLIIVAVLLSFLLIAFVVTSPFEKFHSTDISKALNGQFSKDKNGFVLFKKRENILFLGAKQGDFDGY